MNKTPKDKIFHTKSGISYIEGEERFTFEDLKKIQGEHRITGNNQTKTKQSKESRAGNDKNKEQGVEWTRDEKV